MSDTFCSPFSTASRIIREVIIPNTDKIFGNVLGQIGLRFMNGARPTSIVSQAV